ncbi:MAG: VWA domain-containing protein [Lachnospiraceae bacterium]|nr:VWA domain-containing protein [Lachnospiraceae bacterium]
MAFEFLWPLVFVISVPVILILYLLRPKGVPKTVSSNLIWRRLQGSNSMSSFRQKFLSDPLMYLEMLIALLLVAALMGPIKNSLALGRGDTILVIDTSAGMQHLTKSGKSRFELAKEYALSQALTGNGKVTLIGCDERAGLLYSGQASDKRLKQIIKDLEPSDLAGDLNAATDLVKSLSADTTLVLTDGSGQRQLEQADDDFTIVAFGEEADNLALSYLAVEGENAVAMVSDYSNRDAACDISLLDPDGKLLQNQRIRLKAGEQKNVLFSGLDPQAGPYIKAELSGITFAGEDAAGKELAADSLEKDNVNYAFTRGGSEASAALISGGGNRYLEKAYRAATGKTLSRVATESLIGEEELIIYDFDTYSRDSEAEKEGEVQDPFAGGLKAAGADQNRKARGILRFGGREEMRGELEHVEVTCKKSEITKGIEGAAFGVNKTFSYDVPSWAEPFLMSGEDCVGYYGTDPYGNRRVVVGFDIRESNLPLLAEFPVLVAGSVRYLADQSVLKKQVYTAGESLSLRPTTGKAPDPKTTDTTHTGIFSALTEAGREYYAVLFPMEAESDGRAEAVETKNTQTVKRVASGRSIRNLLLLIALALLGLDLYLYVKKKRMRRLSVYLCTALAACLLLAALLDLRLPVLGSSRATVFLVDLSDSNAENRERMEQYLSDQMAQKPAKDYYGVIAFGGDAQIDQFLTRSDHYTPVQSLPSTTATDLEGAVAKAVTMFDEKTTGRIVLLSDGRETKGRLSRMETALSKSEIELCALFFDTKPKKDVYPSEVQIPSVLHAGDAYRMQVKVESNFETDATIDLMSATRRIQQQKVHLLPGENNFVFGMEVGGRESESFSVSVSAPEDACPENDRYHVYAKVEDQQRLLVIVGKGTEYDQLVRILDAANVEYDIVSVKNAPESLEKLSLYRSILLDDVYIGDLPTGLLADLQAYVRDFGGGLIACGGENSYALGGYRESVLEEILPVDMEPRGLNETPAIGMLMVIDHSGSMSDTEGGGRTRLDLAIEAACRAVDNLSSKDYVGVITFDDSPTWQVPYVQVKDKQAIKEGIQKTKEGGGTMIGPAVKEAYDEISKQDVPIKHILLLTDGQGESNDFSSLTAAIAKAGITLSTVAVGDDADGKLLERMAKQCDGRFYQADEKSDIPRIFAKEVLMSGDSYLQNGNFSLSLNRSNQILEGLFSEGTEQITGYVATSPKPGTMELIKSDKDDPILSAWQYGMGRSVAWTSDVSGVWSGAFLSQEDAARMWKRICEYSYGYRTQAGDRVEYVEADEEGGEKRVRYTTEKNETGCEIEAVATGPDKERKELKLSAKRPGVYEAVLPEGEEGIYYLSVVKKKDGQVVSSVQSAAIRQFSDEYRFEISDQQAKEFVERIGRILQSDESVWKGDGRLRSSARSLTIPLLIAALMVFLFSIAQRRLELGALWAEQRRKKAEALRQEASGEQAKQKGTFAALAQGAERPGNEKAGAGKQGAEQAGSGLNTGLLLKKKRDRGG